MSLSDLLASHGLNKAKTRPLATLPVPRPSPVSAFNFLLSNLVKKDVRSFGKLNEGYDPDLSPKSCESVHELIAAIKRKIKLNKAAEDGIKVIIAAAISTKVDGPFLWTHICGPSSSLKSTLLNLTTPAYDKVFSLTEFKGFFSGSTVGGKDNSLLPQLQDKLFVIHDFTPIIQGRPDTQNEVCSQFRTIYEGTGEAFFKNGVALDYKNVRFACLTGVTRVIYAFRRSDMGERFTIFDINSEWTDDGLNRQIEAELDAEGNAYDNIFATMAGGFSETSGPKLDILDDERRMCWGLLNHLMEYIDDESHGLRALAKTFGEDRKLKAEIDALAVWLEHGRCNLPPKNDPYAVMSPAEPHRSIKQLSKWALTLAVVDKAPACTDEIRGIIRKMAFDTGKSKALEIMNYLAVYPMEGRRILASKMQITDTWVAVWCNHLISIGVLQEIYKDNGSSKAGRQQVLCYQLTQKFRMLADTIGLRSRLHKPVVEKDVTPTGALLRRVQPFGRATT